LLKIELSWFEVVCYRLYITYTLMEFLYDLDRQRNVCSRNIQKIEGQIRCCLPIPQKLHNVTKRLKTSEEVEQYFPRAFWLLWIVQQNNPTYQGQQRTGKDEAILLL
jgi:hypothetical protein